VTTVKAAVVSQPTAAPVASSPSVAGQISINSASKSQLMTLPGIGPSYADKIIAGRPYSTIEQLTNVKGIGDKTMEKLRDLVTL